MPRLPPLQTLRALEAAVRHRSYSRAAAELSLTHGAVSHQVRRMEEDLGVRLFSRQGNVMRPTPAAQELAAAVTESLEQLRRAYGAVAATSDAEPLVLSLSAQFSNRWLAPRLAELQRARLNIKLQVEDRFADLQGDGVDMAVRFATPPYPGFETQPLFGERLFPVCSPALAKRCGLKGPADLARAPVLHSARWPWRVWCEPMGAPVPESEGSNVYDSMTLVDAAVEGLGVALARATLAERDLRLGALVRPFAGEVAVDVGYSLVWRPDSRKLARIHAVRDWFLTQLA